MTKDRDVNALLKKAGLIQCRLFSFPQIRIGSDISQFLHDPAKVIIRQAIPVFVIHDHLVARMDHRVPVARIGHIIFQPRHDVQVKVFDGLSGFGLLLHRQIKSVGMEGLQQNPHSLCGGIEEFRPLLLVRADKTGDMVPGNNKGMAGEDRSYVIDGKKAFRFQEYAFLY